MKFRFINHNNDIYLVVGIGYDNSNTCPDYFVCILLSDKNLYKTALNTQTLNIPFSEAVEITDKRTLTNLMVLYG